MQIKLVDSDNEILRQQTLSVLGELSNDDKEIIRQMKEILIKEAGLGLAAPQVGINKSYFIMNIGNIFSKDPDDIITVVNPTIDVYGSRRVLTIEGCLSFPTKFISISRPDLIHAVYYDENMKKVEQYFTGIHSTVFQHEYDHLQGKCIF